MVAYTKVQGALPVHRCGILAFEIGASTLMMVTARALCSLVVRYRRNPIRILILGSMAGLE